MSKLAAPMKVDFVLDFGVPGGYTIHDDFTSDFMRDVYVALRYCLFARWKFGKEPTRFYQRFYRCTTQLVPGYQHFDIGSYEGLSVNLEASSFWDCSTLTQGTVYERLELYGVPSITLEMFMSDDRASYEVPYAESELTGFHDSGGYVYRDASVQNSGDYEGYSGAYGFCDSGGSFEEYSNISAGPSHDRSHDGYGDTLGPPDIQDNDSGNDVLEFCDNPPMVLCCDPAGKLISVTGSPTYLSGKTDDFKLDDHNDPPCSVPSLRNGASLQSGITTEHSHAIVQLQNEWQNLTTAKEEVSGEGKQQRQALVACDTCYLKQMTEQQQILQLINVY